MSGHINIPIRDFPEPIRINYGNSFSIKGDFLPGMKVLRLDWPRTGSPSATA